MLNAAQLEEILDGTALLECIGNLYEYIGDSKGRHIFQSVTSDYFISLSREKLLSDAAYHIQH